MLSNVADSKKLVELILNKPKWEFQDLEEFFSTFDTGEVSTLIQSIKSTDKNLFIKVLVKLNLKANKKGNKVSVEDLIKLVSDQSFNMLLLKEFLISRSGKDNFISYHNIVLENLKSFGEIRNDFELTTFEIEKTIIKKVTEFLWDRLDSKQKEKLVIENKIELENLGDMTTKELASLSGSALIASLATTVSLSGFSFYTTMSSLIYSAGNMIGLTIPFAGYMGASSTVAFLSGPYGIIIGAFFLLLGLNYKSKRRQLKKNIELAMIISQIHLIKIKFLDDNNIQLKN